MLVDVISREMIEATGAVGTGRLLQKLAPSFNFPQSFVSDGTDLIWPASLRGMGPDQVLVNVQQSIGRGSAGTDINTIPVSAIERIEVLRDGASAIYGSDAIAGVINLILKKQSEGGGITTEYGETTKNDGKTYKIGANGGFKVGNGFINLTAEYVDRSETNRAGPDSLRANPPRVTQRIGDVATKSKLLWLNSEFPLGGGTDIYVLDGGSSFRFRSLSANQTLLLAGISGTFVPEMHVNAGVLHFSNASLRARSQKIPPRNRSIS